MINAIIFVVIIFSNGVFAKSKFRNNSKIPLLEASFLRGRKIHEYTITTEFKNNKINHILSFKDETQKVKFHDLTRGQFESIKSSAIRIIWENEFKKTISIKNCKEYLRLKTPEYKTRICYQNISTTGKSFGFLNGLNHFFR